MIWARSIFSEGALESHPLLTRGGLAEGARGLAAGVLERAALVTGLDARSREALADVAAGAWLAGGGDCALIRYSRSSIQMWCSQLSAHADLARALSRLEVAMVPLAPTAIGPRRFEWGQKTFIMGIVNVTPDSFSDGGQLQTIEAAVAHAVAMVEAGADLIDVGGESTRPGAKPVSQAEEMDRVLPVIERLKSAMPMVPIAVDTSKAAVAKQALEAGAALVNDVTAFSDEAMLGAVADKKACACAMHMQGSPQTMQQQPSYADVVAEVLDGLELALQRAEASGVPRSNVLVDPGIGFGKTAGHNLFLMRRLRDLRMLGAPVLVGSSRKAFLGGLIGGKPPRERVMASAASAAAMAVSGGVDMVRVHDVAQTREALAVADAIVRAREGGSLFEASG